MVIGGVALALVAVYGLWLRDSSLVRVEHVEVNGIDGPEAPEIRAAIVAAARRRTTLNVRSSDLERAVAGHPSVRAVEVDPRLPHGLDVRVIRHRPVARLRYGRRDGPPVAADGTLLPGLVVDRPLPVLESAEATNRRGGRLDNGRALRSVRVLAAAPTVLDRRMAGAEEGRERGMVVRLRRGPDIVFGDLSALGAKWSAAVRVLADPASRGAAYVDVRLPGRPAAGGLAEPEEPPDPATPSEPPTASPAPPPNPQP